MILFNGANPFYERVCLFCIFARNTIYELLIEVLLPVLLAKYHILLIQDSILEFLSVCPNVCIAGYNDISVK